MPFLNLVFFLFLPSLIYAAPPKQKSREVSQPAETIVIETPPPDPRYENLTRVISRDLRNCGCAGAAISIIEGGFVTHSGGIGFRKLGESDLLNEHTLFNTTSVIDTLRTLSFGFELNSKKSLREMITSRLLIPARMWDTTFDQDIARRADHAIVHSKTSAFVSAFLDPTISLSSGDVQLYSSVQDLGRLGALLLRNGANKIDAEIVRSLFQAHAVLQKGAREFTLVSFTGDEITADHERGTQTRIYLVPEYKFGIAVVTNDGEYDPMRIVSKAFEIYLGAGATLSPEFRY